MIAWLLVGLTVAAGYGWAARLLREQGWLAVMLGISISIGALTLIMVAEALVGIPLTLAGITLPYFVLMLPAWWKFRPQIPQLPKTWTERLVLLVLLLIAGAILFNGAYWPFYRADAVGIYQPTAAAIFQTRALVPLTGADSLYHTYPILIPLTYTYAYLAAGWQNEYLAKASTTLLSLACLPAAYVLGRMLHSPRAGWLAALVLALTPFFGAWASAGYVDLPMAFFYTLAAIFALRVWESGQTRDAVIAGALIGLAAWTKNAALIGVPLLAIWLLWGVIQKRVMGRALSLSLAACAAAAGGWYVRNLVGAGFLIPATAWTDQAQHTLDSALVYLTHPENFGASGWLIVGGIGAGLIAARHGNTGARLILLWTLPFFAAWWLFVSYDPRFLLLFLPPLCALAGDLLARAWDWIGAAWHPRYRIVLVLLLLMLTAQALARAVEFKYDLLRAPLMSDAAKHAIVYRD